MGCFAFHRFENMKKITDGKIQFYFEALEETNRSKKAKKNPFIQVINKIIKNDYKISKKDSEIIIDYIRKDIPELEKSPEHTLMTEFSRDVIKYLKSLS